jgi:tetratricopeptide (TPR) repeat protein
MTPIAFHRTASALAALTFACLIGFLGACSSQKPREEEYKPKIITTRDLDSLNREVEHKDSVDANLIFYEEAYQEYRKHFPGVDQSAYIHLAKGKDQEFCLFKSDPAKTCLENGDRLNDMDMKQAARDAYRAGLLSEGYNGAGDNVRLWGSMGQLAIETKDYEAAQSYIRKILEVDPRNQWAKKLSTSIPKEAREPAYGH